LFEGYRPQPYQDLFNSEDGNISLDKVEIEVIRGALEKNNYNQTRTSAALGITRKQLLTKMKKYNLFNK